MSAENTTMNLSNGVSRIAVLLLLSLVAACGDSARASGPASAAERDELGASDVVAIEALASGYSKWALAGDFQQWAELYHPDAVRMNPGQPPLEGREAIHQWANSLGLVPERSNHTMTTIEVEGTREMVFIRGTYRAELVLRMGGEEVALPPDEGSWLAVARRDQHEAWRFYRMIANTDLPPAPVVDQ